ncbi:MAG: hypothetical protein EA425_08790 [Puniceicoccaceae bacterium]|nr:MAG: hypothetical protein EA425_08790 [Puniceicoccaceae bacterium]
MFARSDTFLIRAYGDVVNPLRPNRIIGRAWCEAIVQRIPDYVDPNLNEPHDVPTGNINERLGRRYVITAFRWLSREDI